MNFKLSPELINKILFAMENQNTVFVLDTEAGNVVPSTSIVSGQERYIDLPRWSSNDGYRLRENFAMQLADQDISHELLNTLNIGKGVFRAFKEVLRKYPEIEGQWMNYKNLELKRVICRWYNALKEELRLSSIGEEPEETGDLVVEDFIFQTYKDCIIVRTAGWDYAGCINVVWHESSQYIQKLEVQPEYRGLGLGEALLTHLLQTSESETIFIDLPVSDINFSKVLLRKSFVPYKTRYRLDRKH